MDLSQATYVGGEIDDHDAYDRLPAILQNILAEVNGFILFGGGLHLRGAVVEPDWHSIRKVWTGEFALHLLYGSVAPSDIPFAQDCMGDQFLLRSNSVYRLSSESGELDQVAQSLEAFLVAAQRDPIEYLNLHPLLRYEADGGSLEPGCLLSAYPPFVMIESADDVSLRSVPALERISFLADLCQQLNGDGE